MNQVHFGQKGAERAADLDLLAQSITSRIFRMPLSLGTANPLLGEENALSPRAFAVGAFNTQRVALTLPDTVAMVNRMERRGMQSRVWQPDAGSTPLAIERFTETIVERFPTTIARKYEPKAAKEEESESSSLLLVGEESIEEAESAIFDVNRLPSIPDHIKDKHRQRRNSLFDDSDKAAPAVSPFPRHQLPSSSSTFNVHDLPSIPEHIKERHRQARDELDIGGGARTSSQRAQRKRTQRAATSPNKRIFSKREYVSTPSTPPDVSSAPSVPHKPPKSRPEVIQQPQIRQSVAPKRDKTASSPAEAPLEKPRWRTRPRPPRTEYLTPGWQDGAKQQESTRVEESKQLQRQENSEAESATDKAKEQEGKQMARASAGEAEPPVLRAQIEGTDDRLPRVVQKKTPAKQAGETLPTDNFAFSAPVMPQPASDNLASRKGEEVLAEEKVQEVQQSSQSIREAPLQPVEPVKVPFSQGALPIIEQSRKSPTQSLAREESIDRSVGSRDKDVTKIAKPVMRSQEAAIEERVTHIPQEPSAPQFVQASQESHKPLRKLPSDEGRREVKTPVVKAEAVMRSEKQLLEQTSEREEGLPTESNELQTPQLTSSENVAAKAATPFASPSLLESQKKALRSSDDKLEANKPRTKPEVVLRQAKERGAESQEERGESIIPGITPSISDVRRAKIEPPVREQQQITASDSPSAQDILPPTQKKAPTAVHETAQATNATSKVLQREVQSVSRQAKGKSLGSEKVSERVQPPHITPKREKGTRSERSEPPITPEREKGTSSETSQPLSKPLLRAPAKGRKEEEVSRAPSGSQAAEYEQKELPQVVKEQVVKEQPPTIARSSELLPEGTKRKVEVPQEVKKVSREADEPRSSKLSVARFSKKEATEEELPLAKRSTSPLSRESGQESEGSLLGTKAEISPISERVAMRSEITVTEEESEKQLPSKVMPLPSQATKKRAVVAEERTISRKAVPYPQAKRLKKKSSQRGEEQAQIEREVSEAMPVIEGEAPFEPTIEPERGEIEQASERLAKKVEVRRQPRLSEKRSLPPLVRRKALKRTQEAEQGEANRTSEPVVPLEHQVLARLISQVQLPLTAKLIAVEQLVQTQKQASPLPPERVAKDASEQVILATQQPSLTLIEREKQEPSQKAALSQSTEAATTHLLTQGWRFKRKESTTVSQPHQIGKTMAQLTQSSSSGGGRALQEGTRRTMEGALGRDFSDVRVYTAQLAPLNVQAASRGRDVYVEQGQERFDTPKSMALLGHELTHVAHAGFAQRKANIQRTAILPQARMEKSQSALSSPSVTALQRSVASEEAEAEKSEQKVMRYLEETAPSLGQRMPLISPPKAIVEGSSTEATEASATSEASSGLQRKAESGLEQSEAFTDVMPLIQRAVSSQREDSPPVIQRYESVVASESQESGDSDEGEDKDEGAKLTKLARQIYPIIKRMLSVERERSFGR